MNASFGILAWLATASLSLNLPVERYVLENGLHVVLLPIPGKASVTVGMNYRVGAIDEEPGHSGLAHLVEHLTFFCPVHDDVGVMSFLSSTPVTDFNGMTGADRTWYFESAAPRNLHPLLWMEARRMRLDRCDREMLDREHKIVLQERVMHS